jgi:hypothetical protein
MLFGFCACRPSRTVPQATHAMLKTHSGLRAQDVPESGCTTITED